MQVWNEHVLARHGIQKAVQAVNNNHPSSALLDRGAYQIDKLTGRHLRRVQLCYLQQSRLRYVAGHPPQSAEDLDKCSHSVSSKLKTAATSPRSAAAVTYFVVIDDFPLPAGPMMSVLVPRGIPPSQKRSRSGMPLAATPSFVPDDVRRRQDEEKHTRRLQQSCNRGIPLGNPEPRSFATRILRRSTPYSRCRRSSMMTPCAIL